MALRDALDKLAAEAEAWDKGQVDLGTWKPAPEALIPPGAKVTVTHTYVLRVKPLPGRPEGLPLPAYQTPGAAALDLVAAEEVTFGPGVFVTVGTGLAFEIPEGFEGQVRPRSGMAAKHGVTVLNSPGTLDSDYRGELRVLLVNHGTEPYTVRVGDRIAQLVVASYTRVMVVAVDELSSSSRGAGGFGHTGR